MTRSRRRATARRCRSAGSRRAGSRCRAPRCAATCPWWAAHRGGVRASAQEIARDEARRMPEGQAAVGPVGNGGGTCAAGLRGGDVSCAAGPASSGPGAAAACFRSRLEQPQPQIPEGGIVLVQRGPGDQVVGPGEGPRTGAAAAPGCRLVGLGIGVLLDLLHSALDLWLDGLAVAAGHLDQQVELLGVLDLLRGGGLGLVRQGVEGADLAGGLDQGRRRADQRLASAARGRGWSS